MKGLELIVLADVALDSLIDFFNDLLISLI